MLYNKRELKRKRQKDLNKVLNLLTIASLEKVSTDTKLYKRTNEYANNDFLKLMYFEQNNKIKPVEPKSNLRYD